MKPAGKVQVPGRGDGALAQQVLAVRSMMQPAMIFGLT
jgi:hypothetical protein